MIDISSVHLNIVLNILKKHVPDVEVRVFGSRVGKITKKYSDLDIVLVDIKEVSSVKIATLKEEFSESDLPFRVDVLDWYTTSENFKNIINTKFETIQKAK